MQFVVVVLVGVGLLYANYNSFDGSKDFKTAIQLGMAGWILNWLKNHSSKPAVENAE